MPGNDGVTGRTSDTGPVRESAMEFLTLLILALAFVKIRVTARVKIDVKVR